MPTLELPGMTCHIQGPLAQITLNRPAVLNAMDADWPREMLAVTSMLGREKNVKLVVISGAGRAFCTGMDLKALSGGALPRCWFRDAELAFRAVEQLEPLVIAAVHNYCIGGGLQLALAADLRMVTENTQFALTAVKQGLVPGTSAFRLARYAGLGYAKRIALTGEFFSAQQAQAMGLVDYLVAETEFDRRLAEICENCLKLASEGQRQIKRLLGLVLDLDWDKFLEEYVISQNRALDSREHQTLSRPG
ncbi:MAG TPA: enoyl-CoA hydratase/isomerase family protein [Candidatus Acidoferrum sp.]|nr:enoyl-CoA hydratase/isomerase family protein [Candidatus Acidoferrum sp.]